MSLKRLFSEFLVKWPSATRERFGQHPLSKLFRTDIRDKIEEIVSGRADKEFLIVEASVGQGNWANVPWLAILNKKISETTRSGINPVYLFRADGSGFYLSLNQGTTDITNELGRNKANQYILNVKQSLINRFPKLLDYGVTEIDLLATSDLGKSYESANITAKFYDHQSIPDDNTLAKDLHDLLDIYSEIAGLNLDNLLNHKMVKEKNMHMSNIPLPKPFLLLAGISGTGKTRFVREQAKMTDPQGDNYCLTSVRPDWHEPSDLLGYVSRLNGEAKYITTDVLSFIAKAWRAILDAGLTIDKDQRGKMVVSGEKAELDDVLPYWLCLDEMNLAPVEQYFADYLSVLETREWRWDEDSFEYSSEPLLKSHTIQQLSDKEQKELKKSLGFVDSESNDSSDKYQSLWELICTHGLGIPFNLIVAGTVNMDETTHGFSRKVIDRALSFDFGAFFPNEFQHFLTPNKRNKALSYPIWSQVNNAVLENDQLDKNGTLTIQFLEAVNHVLMNTPFELAFRALNELLLCVVCESANGKHLDPEQHLQAIWDDFLMCKVLPRIEGDVDKLSVGDGLILDRLENILKQQFSAIWSEQSTSQDSLNNQRPDLYREMITNDSENNDDAQNSVVFIPCRSLAKLAWMKTRLDKSGFTSFWP